MTTAPVEPAPGADPMINPDDPLPGADPIRDPTDPSVDPDPEPETLPAGAP